MSNISTGFAATGSSAFGASADNKAAGIVARALVWVAEQRRVNRTVATLSNLSDATLKDIGIDRADIARVARYGRGVQG